MSQPDSKDYPGSSPSGEANLTAILQLVMAPEWARTVPGSAGRASEAAQPEPSREGGRRRGQAERRKGIDRRPLRHPPRAPSPPTGLEVHLLPDSALISEMIKVMRSTRRAYALARLAAAFVAHPELCAARVFVRPGENVSTLFQCRLCREAMTRLEFATKHLLDRHLDEYFVREEVDSGFVEGRFTCVARCGLSGVLLGPPNHHNYPEKLREVHRQRFASMPFEEYCRHIQMVRDEGLIEQWRREAGKSTRYRMKASGSEGGVALTWSQVEARMARDLTPRHVRETRRAIVPLPLALDSADPGLRALVQAFWERERRQPRGIYTALRSAFLNMRLYVFRLDHRGEFVTAIRPSGLDPQHAVEEIRRILEAVRRGGCTRASLTAPEVTDEANRRLWSSHLDWLVEKGHLIECNDGSLWLPDRIVMVTRMAGAERMPPAKDAGGEKPRLGTEGSAHGSTASKKTEPAE